MPKLKRSNWKVIFQLKKLSDWHMNGGIAFVPKDKSPHWRNKLKIPPDKYCRLVCGEMSFHLFLISLVQSLFAEILGMFRDIKFQFTVKSMNDPSHCTHIFSHSKWYRIVAITSEAFGQRRGKNLWWFDVKMWLAVNIFRLPIPRHRTVLLFSPFHHVMSLLGNFLINFFFIEMQNVTKML